jgi:carnitine-CoA ligase
MLTVGKGLSIKGPEVGTIGSLLARQAAVDPDAPFVFFGDEVIGWGQLDADVTRAARGLYDLGLRPGDRIAVLMRNRPEYLLAWLGAVRLGAIYVPVIADNKPPEVDYVLERSGAAALIGSADLVRPLGAVRERCPELRHILLVDADEDLPPDAMSFGQLVKAASASVPGPEPQELDLAQIAFTSGTTNRPKGIVHTHHPYVRIGLEHSRRMGYTPSDRIMIVLPMFHGNAQITSFMPALAARSMVALMPRFSVSQFWAQARRHQATEVNLLTGLQLMLLGRPPGSEDGAPTMQVVFGTTTESVERRFRERFRVPTVTTWSLSECSLGAMGGRHDPYHSEWVGRPLGDDNEIEVVDENDRVLGPGEIGELTLRSSCVMLGYYGQPEETTQALRGDRLHTGDRGFKDAEGNIYFKGRIKHVIRRSGENISGEEVEDTITSHPAVEECAVVAVPDDVRVEEVKAFVVLNQEAHLTPEEIVDFCEDRLATFKVPRYIEYRDSLPMTPRGTVKRFELRQEDGLTDCWDRLAVGYRVQWREQWKRGVANDVTASGRAARGG